jgi:hypothetical protein
MTEVCFRGCFVSGERAGKRDQLPERTDANDDVDQVRERCVGTKERSNKVEIGDADEEPVQAPNDNEEKCNDVDSAHVNSPLLIARSKQTEHTTVPQLRSHSTEPSGGGPVEEQREVTGGATHLDPA